MEPFSKITAVAVPMNQANIDTDQVIPARFLKRPRDDRYHSYLFHDLRFDEAGTENPDFIMNQVPWRNAGILVVDRNFGCGSSREAAVYALLASGFRAVIAPSFGDIFYNNSFKNGFLPVRMEAAEVASLRRQLWERPGAEITVDLETQTVIGPDGKTSFFEIDPFRKHCLLKGLDDIQFTLEFQNQIAAFEDDYGADITWLPQN
jgi:3-isopropylmalate/(R)-2-methylmalate dehydratase small subunit